MENKRIIIIFSIIGVLLSIPLVAMQFTNEVNWTAFDFIIMGILLTVTGLLCEFALRKFKTVKSRVITCAVVLFTFLLVYVELAVGLFGTPFAGN